MMNLESIPIQAFLIVASALFCIGIWGLLNSRNAVRVLMSIELMLNAVNINLMAFSSYVDNILLDVRSLMGFKFSFLLTSIIAKIINTLTAPT